MNDYMRFSVYGTVTQVQEMCTLKGGRFAQVYVAKDVANGKAGSVSRVQFYDEGQLELALKLKRGDRVFISGRFHGWMNEEYLNTTFYGDLLILSETTLERVAREHPPVQTKALVPRYAGDAAGREVRRGAGSLSEDDDLGF